MRNDGLLNRSHTGRYYKPKSTFFIPSMAFYHRTVEQVDASAYTPDSPSNQFLSLPLKPAKL